MNEALSMAFGEAAVGLAPIPAGMASGRTVELMAPDWREIDLDDVALGLSRIRRWAGQTRRPISDAEHSLLVGRLVPLRYRLAADLHDAHEAIVGDLTTPFARALAALAGSRVAWAIAALKWRLDVAIARAVIERFAPARPGGFETFELEAQTLASEMRSTTVREADALAARYEDAVRRRDALRNLDAFGETAALNVGAWAPDEGELAARWLSEVAALTRARFAGGKP
jgi:5'-deoxynucleotidase YfbR-like HD superfamily hydrolase